MANFRKQGQSQYQVGPHWRSSFSSRKPPLPQNNFRSAVPSWEKMFCYSVGSVPWRKLIECKRYMNLHSNVVKWDDSAGKEAFDNAKKRFWAEINGLPCDISLPDPDIYIDNVDWNSIVDPELILDLEREVVHSDEEKKGGEVVIIGGSLLLNNQVLTPTGWGDDEAEASKPVILGGSPLLNNQPVTPNGWGGDEAEAPKPVILGGSPILNYQPLTPTGWGDAEAPKPSDPNSFAQGWDSNLHENNGLNSWEQGYAPVQHAKKYEWQNSQNDSQGWNQREQRYGGELQNKAKGRFGGNGNWNGNGGTARDGWYYRKRENMPWSNRNTSAAYHYGNEYQNQMNRGRRNYRGGGGGGGGAGGGGGGGRGGGRRGHYGYDRPYVEKVPTSKAW